MTLRIIAGEMGGRTIDAPPGRRTRPTPERVREAWFSALAPRLPGARVLDLFAGSGALGIEALSRGAAAVTFVEADGRAVSVLRRNLERLDLLDRAQVMQRNVFAFLEDLRDGGEAYDVALADPPYRSGDARRLVERFREEPFAALLCVEHPPGALGSPAGLLRERRYGDTALSFIAPED